MSFRATVAFATALIACLLGGLWLGGHPSHLPPFLRDAFVGGHAGLNVEATEEIEDNYFREVSGDQLSNASLQGMARGLRREFGDRFSDYFSPESLERFDETIAGRFTGIGLEVAEVQKGLRATHVFKGSPAEKGGIVVGDVIVSVDGESIAGLSSEEATAKIKGPEKTEVTVAVLGKDGEVRKLHLTREQIALPVAIGKVSTVNGHKLGDVSFASFSEGSAALLQKQVEKVNREGAEGIVLDLRENGGGLLQEAVEAASIFLPKGEVVTETKSRTQGHAVYKTVGDDSRTIEPLVLLVDRNTASAAEILTAALADDADVPVVGTRTYGKGVFQQEFPLSNGGAFKLTVGEYFTPDGVDLAESHGIHPDVEVSDNLQTKRDEALDRALRVLAAQRGGGAQE